jgi:hypothetical protein
LPVLVVKSAKPVAIVIPLDLRIQSIARCGPATREAHKHWLAANSVIFSCLRLSTKNVADLKHAPCDHRRVF